MDSPPPKLLQLRQCCTPQDAKAITVVIGCQGDGSRHADAQGHEDGRCGRHSDAMAMDELPNAKEK